MTASAKTAVAKKCQPPPPTTKSQPITSSQPTPATTETPSGNAFDEAELRVLINKMLTEKKTTLYQTATIYWNR